MIKKIILSSSNKCHQIACRNASFFNSIKNFVKVQKYAPPYDHLIQIGDPILRTTSDAVPEELIKSSEVTKLLNQMEKVRRSYGLVAIAAPQIGINLRIFIVCFNEDNMKSFTPAIQKAKELALMPLTVFINPEIKVLDHRKINFEESCGSFIGYAADVERNYSVEVTSFNEKAESTTQTLTGWNARIVQHENDHLNGQLFSDIMDRKTLRCTNYHIINLKAGRVEIPYYPKN